MSTEAEISLTNMETVTIGEVVIEGENGSRQTIPVVMQNSGNSDETSAPPSVAPGKSVIEQEYLTSVEYIKQLETKVNTQANKMMSLEDQLSQGINSAFSPYLNICNKTFLTERGSFIDQLSGNVRGTMKSEFEELNRQLMSKLSTELNAGFERFDSCKNLDFLYLSLTRQTDTILDHLGALSTIKGYVEEAHKTLEVLKEWISDSSASASHEHNDMKLSLQNKFASIELCTEKTAEVKIQLDSIKALIVTSLQVCNR